MKYVAVIVVLPSLLVAFAPPTRANPPRTVPIGCEIVRSRTSMPLSGTYDVVVKNTNPHALPAHTGVDVVVTLANGATRMATTTLQASLAPAASVVVSALALASPPRGCEAAALTDGVRGPLVPPTPGPQATCHPGDGSGDPKCAGSASPCVTTGAGSGRRPGAGCTPAPAPTPSPVATSTCPPQLRPGGGCDPSPS